MLGDRAPGRPVWHCSIRAAPGDQVLSDADCRVIAEDVMRRCGLAGHGPDDPGVPWIAVRHAEDHIHIVAVLGRWDGRPAYPRNDYYRVAEAMRAAERTFGLRELQAADRTAARCPSRAEMAKAIRNDRGVPPRTALCRRVSAAAAVSRTEREFLAGLADSGLRVRLKHSPLDPGTAIGYAVGFPGDVTADGGQIWYGGYRLAPDLSLTRLRVRWDSGSGLADASMVWVAPREVTAAADVANVCSYAAAAATRAVSGLHDGRSGDGDDIAHAAGDVLLAASAASGSPELRQAAWVYQRAARPPWARTPAPSPAGQALRTAARLLGQVRLQNRNDGVFITLVKVLIVLVVAVAEYRTARRQQLQAAAARQASARLTVLVPARRGPALSQGTRRRALPPPAPRGRSAR
jgi:hypothetical protein